MDKKILAVLLLIMFISTIVIANYFDLIDVPFLGTTAIGLSDTIGGTTSSSDFNAQGMSGFKGEVSAPATINVGTYNCDYTSTNVICNDEVVDLTTIPYEGPWSYYSSTHQNSVTGIWVINVLKEGNVDGKFKVIHRQHKRTYADGTVILDLTTRQAIIPPTVSNEIELSLLDFEQTTFQYTDLDAVVGINNNYIDDLSGRVKVVYTITSPWGEESHTMERDIRVPLGESQHNFTIPTGTAEYVKVSAQLFLKGTQNPLYPQFGSYQLQEDEFVSGVKDSVESNNYGSTMKVIGKYIEIPISSIDEKMVLISPTPISLPQRGDCTDNACPEGYLCDEDMTLLCIREDVANNELPCQEVGCPIVTDKSYICSSDGMCTETVWQWTGCESDFDCLSVGGTVCDLGSGLCIKEELVPYVTKCEVNSDCPQPCEGVSTECVVDPENPTNNYCDYYGECELSVVQCFEDADCTNIPSPCAGVGYTCDETINQCTIEGECDDIYLAVDCMNEGTGCPDGYECVLSGIDSTDYVCKKDTKLTCLDTGCPSGYECLESSAGWTCNKETTVTQRILKTAPGTTKTVEVIPTYVWIAITILILSLVFVLLKWRGIL